MDLSIYLSIYLSTYLSISLSLYLSISLSLYPSIALSLYLSIYLFCLSIYLPVYLQAWKPSYSARCLQCSKLTTSKTKQFCETSSMFELDNVKKEAILRDLFIFKVDNIKNAAIQRDFLNFCIWLHLTTSKSKQFCETFFKQWKVQCSADSLVPMRFAIFPLHLSKVLRLPRKSDARSYEVLHLSRKIILANLKIWYSKMQPLSGNQRPDLLTSLMNMSFVLRRPRKMHLCRSSSNVPCLPWFLEMLQNPHVLLTFEEVHNPLRLPRETTSEPPQVVRT